MLRLFSSGALSLCLWRHHRRSVWLAELLCKILIVSPPCLLAFGVIGWQRSAATEPERWLKWPNETLRRKEQNRLIKLTDIKGWLPLPSSINQSVSFLSFIICSHTPHPLTALCALSVLFGARFIHLCFLGNDRLNMTERHTGTIQCKDSWVYSYDMYHRLKEPAL